ncbi:MAG: isomerizing glutamine--fructose-6-phosphate transaminase, partial [Bdellovibrionales bacterium]|nr:isomerizing glutamine--fructose-6-phosphate transaminase [Bdellovibrionales bacterium]
LAGIPVEVDYGSEYRYRNPLVDEKTMLVVVSQSGETADTLGSLNVAVEKGAKTLAICNVVGSSIARKAGNVFYTHAGPEISVASTKAFVAQLTAGYLLALRMGAARGKLTEDQVRNYLDDLVHVPAFVSHALSFNEQAEQIARTYGKARDFLYLGRGILYPIALEGALKLKEISYVHAEGYPAGELKHGPIALISEETPVVALLGHDGVNYDKAMSNIVEVQARGGKVIVITDRETEALTGLKADAIALGDVPPLMQPIVFSIPLQLLAYHIAVYRGTDVDQPRNLAKSVTVE